VLYFAFGSNLDVAQMLRRCPDSRLVGRAVLKNHALCFAGYSAFRHGAVASVTPRNGSQTQGVVYELDSYDLRALDACEGHPFVYQRVARLVVLSDGRRVRAHTYVHRSHYICGPGSAYLNLIRRAYQKHGFDLRSLKMAAWGMT
jgi:gamma-glutamylcyclotransferase (GGCT)/AIG2-like uncharacterized protein YtfP